MEPPALWPTVVITLFFSIFGLIPAAIAANQAQMIGADSGRYWKAFIIIMLVEGAALTLLYVVLYGALFSLMG